NQYRISSARLKNWNYGSEGFYYVTICTKDRSNSFGEINKGIINLSELGSVVQSEWIKTPALRPDMNLQLGEFVVMPNHIHGIISIGKNAFHPGRFAKNKFGPQSKNLASIIRGFKSSVTTYARKNNICFNWQARFHEHIIRGCGDYLRITEY